jgi:hypothetical protein
MEYLMAIIITLAIVLGISKIIVPKNNVAKNPHISGIGGWLGLLVIGLMILGPLLGASKLSHGFSDTLKQFPQLANNAPLENYKQVSWLIFAVSASVSFAAGYRLWKIHFPKSVRFAVLALWLAGPLSNVLYAISAIAIFGSSNVRGDAIVQIIMVTILSVIAAGIWTAYLMRSVRVRNTYKMQHSVQ